MKLLYDLIAIQPSIDSKFHGGGLYGEVVFFALLEKLEYLHMYCIYDSTKYLNPQIKKQCVANNIVLIDINQVPLYKVIDEYNIDIYYSSILTYISDFKKMKCLIVGTFHGVRPLEMYFDSTAFNYASTLKEKIIFAIKYVAQKQIKTRIKIQYYNPLFNNKNFRFVTVSQHSKYSILSSFPFIKEENVKVYYSPLMDKLECDDIKYTEIPPSILRKKYFLLTSGNRWLKNNLRGAIALDEIFTEHQNFDFNVVITGVSNPKIYTRKLKNINRFIFMDYVDRCFLDTLYKEAYALIYPSLNEGFGYPPIEAMKYGVPVAASGISSIPEICENAVLYFNPYSISEIKNRVLQLMNKDIYSIYVNRAKLRYKYVAMKQKEDLNLFVEYLIHLH